MSGIFGVFNRNGKPVEEKIVHTMLDAMSYWDPDERDMYIDGPVALGHTMLWNTPESKYEHLPLKEDAYVLTMDARIDNRDALVKEIALPDRPLSHIGDSEFILGAYKKWGEECPKHLLGDFAFAIWDEKKQQLFCVRDHVGVKQFYYHLSDDFFLFGNDLKVVTKYPNISQEINDEAVANYIVNHQLLSNTLTFFETFKKLPPAHTLTVTSSKVQETCYWRLEDAPKVKLPNAEAYAKKLRELLEEAVYARMRSDYPITSHLSGGLDSSSIAVLAARKLKEKGEKLLAFNWLYQPSLEEDPDHHEWKNSQLIAKKEHIEHYFVDLPDKFMYESLKTNDIKFGDTTGGVYEKIVQKMASSKNSRLILSGWGGDEIISYHGQAFYSDLLRKMSFKKLYFEIHWVTSKYKIKSILSFLYRKLIIPNMPRSLYCLLPRIFCPKNLDLSVYKNTLHKLIIQKENAKDNVVLQPYGTIRKHMLAFWNNKHIQSRIESWSSSSRNNHIEYVYPLLDKRIIEFALGVPSSFFISKKIVRYLYKNSTRDLFPSEMLWKDYKFERKQGYRSLSIILDALVQYKDDMRKIKTDHQYVEIEKLQEEFENFHYEVSYYNEHNIQELIQFMNKLNVNTGLK